MGVFEGVLGALLWHLWDTPFFCCRGIRFRSRVYSSRIKTCIGTFRSGKRLDNMQRQSFISCNGIELRVSLLSIFCDSKT